MLREKLWAMCAMSLSGVALSAPMAQAAAPTVTKVPIVLSASAQSGIESCVGETVTVTDGEFNIVYMPDTLFHRNIAGGRGIGDTTGSGYRLSGHIQEVDHYTRTDGETYTYLVQLNASATTGASFSAKGLFHLTFTPAGELVAYSDSFRITCG